MANRTLVITLGQLRAHELTWKPFKRHVLDQLQADLAVCVPHDDFFDFRNPFYVNARFRWSIPHDADVATSFDRIQQLLGSAVDWRILCKVPGSWLGRIAESGQPGAAAILFVLRWAMLDSIQAAGLTQVYDRFVVTRSDFYYPCPHPPLDCLDPEGLWIPDGEDYGGLCDRHLVVSAADLSASCNLIDDLLLCPTTMYQAMLPKSGPWNIEQVISLHLGRSGLLSRIKRFPYIMFLVRTPEDPTAASTGTYHPDRGMTVKYPSELYESERYSRLITSSGDWRHYFASLYFADLLPYRIYSTHGTVLYVDDHTGELRHGPLATSPVNVFFVRSKSHGKILYSANDFIHAIARSDETGRFYSLRDVADEGAAGAARFEEIPIARGFGLDQTLMTNNLVGLRTSETYLSAEPGGAVIGGKMECLMWEHFRLICDFKNDKFMPQYFSRFSNL